MSQSEEAAFAALASDISARCADAIEADRLGDIPDDSLGQVFASVRPGGARILRRQELLIILSPVLYALLRVGSHRGGTGSEHQDGHGQTSEAV